MCYLITGVQNTDCIVGEADYLGDIYKEKLMKTGEAHFTCRCVHRRWISSEVDRPSLKIERHGIKLFCYEI